MTLGAGETATHVGVPVMSAGRPAPGETVKLRVWLPSYWVIGVPLGAVGVGGPIRAMGLIVSAVFWRAWKRCISGLAPWSDRDRHPSAGPCSGASRDR